MSGHDQRPRPSVLWRVSTPGYLAVLVGGATALLGVGLGLWSLSWGLPSGPDAGLARGLAVWAIFLTMGFAVVFVLLGVTVGLVGWDALRNDRVLAAAIVGGTGLGGFASAAASALTMLAEGPTLVSAWNLLPPMVGAVAGWRWSVRIRRRHGDETAITDRPVLLGIGVGTTGVVLGVVLLMLVPPIGVVSLALGVLVVLASLGWYAFCLVSRWADST